MISIDTLKHIAIVKTDWDPFKACQSRSARRFLRGRRGIFWTIEKKEQYKASNREDLIKGGAN